MFNIYLQLLKTNHCLQSVRNLLNRPLDTADYPLLPADENTYTAKP